MASGVIPLLAVLRHRKVVLGLRLLFARTDPVESRLLAAALCRSRRLAGGLARGELFGSRELPVYLVAALVEPEERLESLRVQRCASLAVFDVLFVGERTPRDVAHASAVREESVEAVCTAALAHYYRTAHHRAPVAAVGQLLHMPVHIALGADAVALLPLALVRRVAIAFADVHRALERGEELDLRGTGVGEVSLASCFKATLILTSKSD